MTINVQLGLCNEIMGNSFPAAAEIQSGLTITEPINKQQQFSFA
jgi:hypothetical protein